MSRMFYTKIKILALKTLLKVSLFQIFCQWRLVRCKWKKDS